jgi:hypothetical protein
VVLVWDLRQEIKWHLSINEGTQVKLSSSFCYLELHIFFG